MSKSIKKILFICSNDGSDMRIFKEVRSLSLQFEIYFLGEGFVTDKSFVKNYCKQFYLTNIKRNTLRSLLKRYYLFFKLTRINSFDSYHIINEQTLLFFLPFLRSKNFVLDIFDSIFLRLNKPGNQVAFLKQYFYKPAKNIIVTDENRKGLMPTFCKDKILVIENYPHYFSLDKNHSKTTKNGLTIFYSGSLGYKRGTEFLQNLINANSDFKVIMAGWIMDNETKEFACHRNVEYRGVMSQFESNKIAANEADFILCIYNPINVNNINASPNKIFDAIQTGTPVIINSEIKISNFVLEKGIGYVIESFVVNDYGKLTRDLKQWIKTYRFDPSLKEVFCWENIESKLLRAHQ